MESVCVCGGWGAAALVVLAPQSLVPRGRNTAIISLAKEGGRQGLCDRARESDRISGRKGGRRQHS